ncbi:MAG TPA: VWA domain-containing protein, partial [Dehalococcoidia bacterium]|nr:VWA domain-containing protein [Dehalococcoidia bacterium]
MAELDLECKLSRNYALENVADSLAYLLIKATPNPTINFGSLPLNLGIVIDVSASMRGDKIRYAREASKFVVESLSPDDMVSVVIFSDDTRVVVPHSKAREKSTMLPAIDKIRPASGTRMYKGIETAAAEMRKAAGLSCINFMIILTDGETEGEEQCLSVVQQEMRNRFTISTFGIGDKYNERLLKAIADATLGKIYHLQTAEQIKAHFEAEVKAARAVMITNVTLNLSLADGVGLEEVNRIFPNSAKLESIIGADGKTYAVDINSLAINEPSYFGVKMVLPARASGPA